MWFEKLFKWSKKDKSDEDDLFKFIFPKVSRVYPSVVDADSVTIHPDAQKALDKRRVANEALDNIDALEDILYDIPKINIKMETFQVKARKRKLKSKYKVEYD